MTSPKARVTSADTEAAQWHARLGEPTVATRTIEDFFAWHQRPEHAEAYRRVQQIWGQSPGLAGRPRVEAALEEALSRRRTKGRDPVTSKALLGLALVATAAVLAFGGFTWLEARGLYATDVGEQRVIQLTDGSTVRLDTASRIRVRFSQGRRDIALEAGQAMFTVAHDQGRPFVVSAGGSTVTAVGTMFQVERKGGQADVTLVEGVVEVRSGAEAKAPVRMAAGERVRMRGAITRIEKADVARETSWVEGQIILRDTPLREAVDQVNRYLTDKVELDAPAMEGVPVNGVFRTGDRDAFVSTVSQAMGMRVAAKPGGGVRLSEPGK